jgi:hypothetical protein
MYAKGRQFHFFLVTVDSRRAEVFFLVFLLAALVAIAAVAHHAALAGFGASWVAWTVTVAAFWLWGADRYAASGIAERAALEAARSALRRLPLVVDHSPIQVSAALKRQKIISKISALEFTTPFALSTERSIAPRILPIPRACRA